MGFYEDLLLKEASLLKALDAVRTLKELEAGVSKNDKFCPDIRQISSSVSNLPMNITKGMPITKQAIIALKDIGKPCTSKDVTEKIVELNPTLSYYKIRISVNNVLSKLSKYPNSPVLAIKRGVGRDFSLYEYSPIHSLNPELLNG